MEKNNSGFKIIGIYILETNFNRYRINNHNDNVEPKVSLNIEATNEENLIISTINFLFETIYNGEKDVSCSIKVTGHFEKTGNNPLNVDEFSHVNAASILFPYLREHFSSLSIKAGMPAITLPPINFLKNYQNTLLNKKKE